MQFSSSIETIGIASAFMVLIQKRYGNPRVGLTTNLNLKLRTESITTPLEVSLLSEPVPISKATLGRHHESYISAHFKP